MLRSAILSTLAFIGIGTTALALSQPGRREHVLGSGARASLDASHTAPVEPLAQKK